MKSSHCNNLKTSYKVVQIIKMVLFYIKKNKEYLSKT